MLGWLFGKKKEQSEPQGEQIGLVIGYFSEAKAAVIDIKKGSLEVGDSIWIKGHTTDLKQPVKSMQIDCKPITKGTRGKQVGLEVKQRVRRNDRVYKL